MGSIPVIGHDADRLTQIEGAMPRLTDIPTGCAFNPRCPQATDRCLRDRPEPMPTEDGQVACWLFEKEAAHV
jgi:peptide/nickel transport system ATP-binding protein